MKEHDALLTILKMAKEHPLFDPDLFEKRDYTGLSDIGGDVADWTYIAMMADDALHQSPIGPKAAEAGAIGVEAGAIKADVIDGGKMSDTPIKTVAEKIAAQNQYQIEKHLPNFAPSDGICYRCRRQIYGRISFEKASTELITGCPLCYQSYCD
jgi:hypothetical protein